jgi:hypothetical protein
MTTHDLQGQPSQAETHTYHAVIALVLWRHLQTPILHSLSVNGDHNSDKGARKACGQPLMPKPQEKRYNCCTWLLQAHKSVEYSPNDAALGPSQCGA